MIVTFSRQSFYPHAEPFEPRSGHQTWAGGGAHQYAQGEPMSRPPTQATQRPAPSIPKLQGIVERACHMGIQINKGRIDKLTEVRS
jgi:hypothetical protein